ncbi:MAG: hypothetical protein J1G06_00285 [Oscillospiraceae bacterium]|nr:hypothetical protein [Oscillospiraceae bacterium]
MPIKTINHQTEFQPINPTDQVTVFQTPRYTEIIDSKNFQKNNLNFIPTKKIDKDHFIDTRTGEIKEYNKTSTKNISSFKESFKDVPRYIKGFFYGDDTERFVTLTYSEFMSEPERLSKDFQKFLNKLKRRYGKLRYFYIKEPDTRGSWHIHSLIKRLDGQSFNITDDSVRKLWKRGIAVNVQKINNVNTMSYYFDITRYENKIQRISFYPTGMKIYSCSADMNITKLRTKYSNIKKYIGDKELTYRRTDNVIMNHNDGINNLIGRNSYEQYTKR